MRIHPVAALAACGLIAAASLIAQRIRSDSAKKRTIPLPTSKVILEPVPGDPQRVNSFPANMAVSPNGRYVAILNAGWGTRESNFSQSIGILDRQSNTIKDFPDPRLVKNSRQIYFLGIAFSGDGAHVYASMGSITDPTGAQRGNAGNGIAVYSFHEGALQPERFIAIPLQKMAAGKRIAAVFSKLPPGTASSFPAGIAVIASTEGERLLVANNLSDDALLLDAQSGRILQRYDLSTRIDIPGSYPYMVVASRDGRRAWCSLWNASRVAELDLEHGKVVRWIALRMPQSPIATGSHPTALLLSPDEKYLYVTLANEDSVAVITAATGRIARLFSTQLPGQQYRGAYPQALAQSTDGTRLFVANASSDAIAVFDTHNISGGAKPLGFIPTELYPSALAVVGDELVIASAKGTGTGPNSINWEPSGGTIGRGGTHPYILALLAGSVARVRIFDAERDLAQLTGEVLESNLMNGRAGRIEFAAGRNPIQHVIYIIKENRTYDQVFGDIKEGNGDPSLVMYGEGISPNHHQLARQFGIVDNFYDSGEVSGDGHVWSNAAIGSDYTERIVQLDYRGRERTYDFEGQVAAEVPMEHGIPDVNEPSTGYLWTNAARHRLTYRIYGEYMATRFCDGSEQVSPHERDVVAAQCSQKSIHKGEPLPKDLGNPPGGPSPYPWPVPIVADVRPTKPELRGHGDLRFPSFNTSYPDQLRADEFLREFAGYVRARQQKTGEQLPNFVLLRLPNDHTAGTRANIPKPAALVADNDLALGRVVEAVSHSPYWDDTAILVLEDDAQNGADHVDAHRSLALVISKYAPGTPQRPFVDSHFYTTVNMIHTIEALLGLPPMNNNDARAAVMAPLFSGPGTQPPFKADYRNHTNGLIYTVNPPQAPGASESAAMDFSTPDSADTELLNAILWREAKGDVPMPQPKHTVIPVRTPR
jgi:DNA-binding beta-propeller fold protein YncE